MTINRSIAIVLCPFLVLLVQSGFAQSIMVTEFINLDTLSRDKKIESIRKQLPIGWIMRTVGKELYVEHIDKVWLPWESLRFDDRVKEWVTRTEIRDGRKVEVVEIKPCLRYYLEPRWSLAKMGDSVRYNNELTAKWASTGPDGSKLKRVPTHMSTNYSIFFIADYGNRPYLLTNVYNQFQRISKLINQSWKSTY